MNFLPGLKQLVIRHKTRRNKKSKNPDQESRAYTNQIDRPECESGS